MRALLKDLFREREKTQGGFTCTLEKQYKVVWSPSHRGNMFFLRGASSSRLITKKEGKKGVGQEAGFNEGQFGCFRHVLVGRTRIRVAARSSLSGWYIIRSGKVILISFNVKFEMTSATEFHSFPNQKS